MKQVILLLILFFVGIAARDVQIVPIKFWKSLTSKNQIALLELIMEKRAKEETGCVPEIEVEYDEQNFYVRVVCGKYRI